MGTILLEFVSTQLLTLESSGVSRALCLLRHLVGTTLTTII